MITLFAYKGSRNFTVQYSSQLVTIACTFPNMKDANVRLMLAFICIFVTLSYIFCTCEYQISGISCNDAVTVNYLLYSNEPFVELERICTEPRAKRSKESDLIFHDLSGYRLVIWDCFLLQSRIVAALLSLFAETI